MKCLPLFLVATLALSASRPAAAAEPTASRAPTVNVITARKSPIASELVLPASLQAFQEALVYARTTGYLSKWLVDIGDQVKAGQTLAVIDSPEIDQQLNQTQAALTLARANAALAKATADRWKSLAEKDAVSAQEVEEKTAAAAASAASVQAAEAEASRLAQLKSFEIVTAPFDGVVSSRGADIGTLITTDTNRPLLFRLTQQSKLRVYVNIPQTYFRAVQPGLDVEVLVNEYPSHSFHGKVTRVAGALDAASRTLLAEVQIPNEKGELLPGMFVQMKFKLTPAEPPLLVPSNAVIIRADGNFVALVEAGNKVLLQKVTFGRDYGAQLEILTGLTDGATVIANPSDALTNGLIVEPLAPDKK